ncbi:F1F0 ATP synthase subunit e, mitochondrial [Malassezia vespertilionis]|uniref:F1F0 ATP synthase subunit e, mitochondrial n=1 Tax=Malassezia vespertilionis TaxID=2020962 RepID=UPI0024B1D884|nr:F1F0 ATP synthase subunit e, mitochondrial [Malassezia vespertilionis]WFD05979.1 F1F0 ATP synthase subunit e, mitochondrial [Malassezia vespertilionis]
MSPTPVVNVLDTRRYDERVLKHEEKRHEQLIKEAKEAYAKTKSVGMTRTPAVISDPEDPNFDLEKLVNYWAKE